ncbi:hypothetical protein I547_2053 [Mycobacterium kansasii 824]|nr:hypothetical protein I547_2053 [Mycobacterium kansasii 824]
MRHGPDAVHIARTAGRAAMRLDDGMLEWRLAGLPVHEGEAVRTP